jgi:Family of unknown function (DUF5302)
MADASGPEPSEDVAGTQQAAQDDMKRKFREALERKRAKEQDVGGALRGKDTGKVQGAHGPARSRRSFRRRGEG